MMTIQMEVFCWIAPAGSRPIRRRAKDLASVENHRMKLLRGMREVFVQRICTSDVASAMVVREPEECVEAVVGGSLSCDRRMTERKWQQDRRRKSDCCCRGIFSREKKGKTNANFRGKSLFKGRLLREIVDWQRQRYCS